MWAEKTDQRQRLVETVDQKSLVSMAGQNLRMDWIHWWEEQAAMLDPALSKAGMVDRSRYFVLAAVQIPCRVAMIDQSQKVVEQLDRMLAAQKLMSAARSDQRLQ